MAMTTAPVQGSRAWALQVAARIRYNVRTSAQVERKPRFKQTSSTRLVQHSDGHPRLVTVLAKPERMELAHCKWDASTGTCCGLDCTADYTAKQVQILRKSVHTLAEHERHQWLKNRIRINRGLSTQVAPGDGTGYESSSCASAHSDAAPQFDRKAHQRTFWMEPPDSIGTGRRLLSTVPEANLQRVCCRAFFFLTSTSRTQIYGRQRSGDTPLAHSIPLSSYPRLRCTQRIVLQKVVYFLRDLGEYYCQAPNEDLVLLPFPSKSFVYEMMLSTIKQAAGAEPEEDSAPLAVFHCAYRYFCQIWKSEPSTRRIKIRKWLKFSKCDVCVIIRDRLNKTHNIVSRAALKKQSRAHHLEVQREREAYYERRKLARESPDEYLSITIDGADQGAYGQPYFHEKSKAHSKYYKIRVHVMGVLAHGRRVDCYTYLDNVRHGSNATLESLMATLRRIVAEHGGRLPATLFIQLDNTTGSNKNQFVMTFMGYLIHREVFKKILVSFLPVGHTHEDIDQFFSRLAVYLRCHDAVGIPALGNAIQKCFRSREGAHPHHEHWDTVANISDWLRDLGTHRSYPDITMYRQFCFTPSATDPGNVEVTVRAKAYDGAASDEGCQWRSLRVGEDVSLVFKDVSMIPSTMHDVPDAQIRLTTGTPEEKKHISMVTKSHRAFVQDAAWQYQLADGVVNDLMSLVDKLESLAPIPFHWVNRDLADVVPLPEDPRVRDERLAAERAADEEAAELVSDVQQSARRAKKTPNVLCEEKDCESTEYQIGDCVLLYDPHRDRTMYNKKVTFTLAQVVDTLPAVDGATDDSQWHRYEVQFLESKADYGEYSAAIEVPDQGSSSSSSKPTRNKGQKKAKRIVCGNSNKGMVVNPADLKPHVGIVWADSVQCIVNWKTGTQFHDGTPAGGKMTTESRNRVKLYVDSWARKELKEKAARKELQEKEGGGEERDETGTGSESDAPRERSKRRKTRR